MKTSDAMEVKHSPTSPVSIIGMKKGNAKLLENIQQLLHDLRKSNRFSFILFKTFFFLQRNPKSPVLILPTLQNRRQKKIMTLLPKQTIKAQNRKPKLSAVSS
jgi:hypothetical protein